MAHEVRKRSTTDTIAHEVDRLLKQLPGADPKLQGDLDSESLWRSPKSGGPARATAAPTAANEPPPPSERALQVVAWGRALLAAAVAAAMTQWPYAHACGWALYTYGGVIATIMIAGGWASIWGWRVRSPGAHLLSLGVVFWGIVLAAEQILPRIGYAREIASWSCGG
jgi:hypothetical protein